MAIQPKDAKLPENPSASDREDGALGFALPAYDVRPAGALGKDAVSAAEALAAEVGANGGSQDSEPSTPRTRAPSKDA